MSPSTTSALIRKARNPLAKADQKPADQTPDATPRPKAGAPRQPQALGGLVERSLSETLKAKGFADTSVHNHWAEIAGADLAAWSEPVSLRWPQRGPGADPDKAREGAVLTVKVESAFALDLQHMAPQIMERVNRFIGWRCVEKLALKQGPVRKGERPVPRQKAVLTAETSRRLDGMLEDIESEALKRALQRLGIQVLGTR
jgi:hypothetical protein